MNLNYNCRICGQKFTKFSSLNTHIQFHHKEYNSKKYYDEFCKKEGEDKCRICGKQTEYRGITVGYLNYCSKTCSHQTKEFKNKFKSTIENKTEQEINEWRTKIKESRLKNNGSYISEKEKENRRNQSLEHIKEYLEHSNCKLVNVESNKNIKKVIYCCNICNRTFSNVRSLIDRYSRENNYKLCPVCYNRKSISRPEKELASFIKETYSGNILRNDRTLLKGNELDIYLPDKNLAFEMDGLFLHMDNRFYKPSDVNPKTGKLAKDIWNKDLTKIKLCEQVNVKLIRIKEYDWINDKENIKKQIAELL